MKIIKVRLQDRDKMVRDLTPSDCGDLLVHAHSITPERRRALLFKRGPAKAYFDEIEWPALRAWIEAETHLAQDDPRADHPKLPTHWCDYCGRVERCKHDRNREYVYV
jgi:hypothetical protein